MKEVVHNEVLNLLDASIIYSISDSTWVSPVLVMFKKGGTSVVKNENNELASTKTVIGWKVITRLLLTLKIRKRPPSLATMDFDFEIHDKKGCENSVAYHLYKLVTDSNDDVEEIINDMFPNEKLWVVKDISTP
eukprot:XP_015574128.1 uncharacterized protein LOC107261185 [Ricinus communis]